MQWRLFPLWASVEFVLRNICYNFSNVFFYLLKTEKTNFLLVKKDFWPIKLFFSLLFWGDEKFITNIQHQVRYFMTHWNDKMYTLKINKSRKQFMVSSILPKNNRNFLTLLLWYLRSNCFFSFFGRIEDTKKTFRN